jgi:hypothetical protein
LVLPAGVAAFGGDSRVVEEGDSPSTWAPPLGEGVISGLTLAPCSLPVDELGVAVPRVVGDAVGYGLAVAVARGLGDAGVGRGEAVVAGDGLWVWPEIETIAAPTTATVAPNSGDVFISDKDWRQTNRAAKKIAARRCGRCENNWRSQENAFPSEL